MSLYGIIEPGDAPAEDMTTHTFAPALPLVAPLVVAFSVSGLHSVLSSVVLAAADTLAADVVGVGVAVAVAARASATFRSTSIARWAWKEPALARVEPSAVMYSCVEGGKEAGQLDVSVEMMGWSFAVAVAVVVLLVVVLLSGFVSALVLALAVDVSRARREKAWTVLMDGLLRRFLRM